MLETFDYPQNLLPEELDLYLSKGWFRMGQSIYTTNYVAFNDKLYPAIWLRHVLRNYTGGKSFNKLKKRNSIFKVELKHAKITARQRELYGKYKAAMNFETSASLEQLLFGFVFVPTNIYNTYQIEIYDNTKLIACTFFDIGKKSAEGISAFYDPDYTAHSLGRYLIYLQIEVCKENNFTYFYPGYFVPGYAHLDYKLAIDKSCLEYLDTEDLNWYAIEAYKQSNTL